MSKRRYFKLRKIGTQLGGPPALTSALLSTSVEIEVIEDIYKAVGTVEELNSEFWISFFDLARKSNCGSIFSPRLAFLKDKTTQRPPTDRWLEFWIKVCHCSIFTLLISTHLGSPLLVKVTSASWRPLMTFLTMACPYLKLGQGSGPLLPYAAPSLGTKRPCFERYPKFKFQCFQIRQVIFSSSSSHVTSTHFRSRHVRP